MSTDNPFSAAYPEFAAYVRCCFDKVESSLAVLERKAFASTLPPSEPAPVEVMVEEEPSTKKQTEAFRTLAEHLFTGVDSGAGNTYTALTVFHLTNDGQLVIETTRTLDDGTDYTETQGADKLQQVYVRELTKERSALRAQNNALRADLQKAESAPLLAQMDLLKKQLDTAQRMAAAIPGDVARSLTRLDIELKESKREYAELLNSSARDKESYDTLCHLQNDLRSENATLKREKAELEEKLRLGPLSKAVLFVAKSCLRTFR